MPRDNRCIYMTHVFCVEVCCVFVYVMYVEFSICIVRRGAVGSRVWEV